MITAIFANAQNTLVITCKLDAFEADFTVMDVIYTKGSHDLAVTAGLRIQKTTYSADQFITLATNANVSLTTRSNNATSATTKKSVTTALAISTATSITAGYINTPYSYSGFVAVGGTGVSASRSYTWALDPANNAVPTGLTLYAAGVLSGTPTGSTTTYNFHVIATDSFGQTVNKAHSLVMNAATTTTTSTTSTTTHTTSSTTTTTT